MSTVEILDGLKRRISIKLDVDEVKAEIEQRLKKLARNVRIDGFRPGKVPMKMIRDMHGNQVEYEVINDKIGHTYRQLIDANELKSAGYPDISPAEDGTEYEFQAEFEVMPEFELHGLEALSAVKQHAEVTDNDIDEMLLTLRKQQSTWHDVEREAKLDDRLMIDFIGRADGEEFPGGKGTNVPLVLGSKSMIPGFEDALVGVKKGEVKTIQVTFPEEYHAENLKGKPAEFDVTVHEVAEVELPEIDAEFAKKFNIADGNIDKLRSELRLNMERELKAMIQNNFKNELMSALEKANEIDVPQSLINAEVQNMARQANFPEPKNAEQEKQLMQIAGQSFGEEAKKRARLGLLISKFIETEKIELDEKYVDQRINLIASTYEDPEEVREYFKNDKESRRSIRNLALEDQIVDLLSEKANITIEEKTFQELMNPNKK